jgi:hypothetical protein
MPAGKYQENSEFSSRNVHLALGRLLIFFLYPLFIVSLGLQVVIKIHVNWFFVYSELGLASCHKNSRELVLALQRLILKILTY